VVQCYLIVCEKYFTVYTPVLHELAVLVFVHKCIYYRATFLGIFQNYFIFNSSVHNYSIRQNTELLFRLKPFLSTFCSIKDAYFGRICRLHCNMLSFTGFKTL